MTWPQASHSFSVLLWSVVVVSRDVSPQAPVFEHMVPGGVAVQGGCETFGRWSFAGGSVLLGTELEYS